MKSEENIYESICKSITNRANQVNWADYTPVDWEQLAEISESQGVGQLLYWSFSKIKEPVYNHIPQNILARLLYLYLGTAKLNMLLFSELQIILDMLDEAKIRAVVLKGAALANTVYEDTGLRGMSDIDLLLPQDQIPLAVQLANSMGYYNPIPEAGPGLKKILDYHIHLQREDNMMYHLELHSSLVGGEAFKYSAPMDWFWTQTEPFRIDKPIKKQTDPETQNIITFKLTPTAQLLHSAAHMMLQHGSGNTPLIWLYDIDRIVEVDGDRINWDELITQARIFKWEGALYETLQQAHLILNTPIPDAVLNELNVSEQQNFSRIMKIKEFSSESRFEAEWKKLASMNWYGRFRLTLALVFPSPGYMRWRYKLENSWSLPFYYLYRWMDVLKDGFRTLFNLIRTK